MMKKTRATLLHVIEAFCKSHKTDDVKLSDLYDQFKSFVEKRDLVLTHSSSEFELGLLFLNKRVIDRVRKKSAEYVSKFGAEAYKMFIQQEENISYDLWTEVLKKERIIWPLNVEKKPEIQINAAQNADSEKEFKKKRLAEFKQALPVDWADMQFAKRVDFVKNIQHKDFRDYVLTLDSKLKKFFKDVAMKKPTSIKMYVTLFSFPSDTTSPEAKMLLKRFVEQLNLLGRTRLQYVECSNISTVEIREVR